MSWITTCVLVVDGCGKFPRERIEGWIHDHVSSSIPKQYELVSLNETFRGPSYPQVDLYGCALRYVDIDDFVAFLRTLPWEKPSPTSHGDVVQLIVNDEHDLGVRMIDIHGKPKVGVK